MSGFQLSARRQLRPGESAIRRALFGIAARQYPLFVVHPAGGHWDNDSLHALEAER